MAMRCANSSCYQLSLLFRHEPVYILRLPPHISTGSVTSDSAVPACAHCWNKLVNSDLLFAVLAGCSIDRSQTHKQPATAVHKRDVLLELRFLVMLIGNLTPVHALMQ